MDLKRCPRCEQLGRSARKPLDEFARDASRSSGYSVWCKLCLRENRRAWKERYPDRYQAYIDREVQRARTRSEDPAFAEQRRAIERRYDDRHREERNAKQRERSKHVLELHIPPPEDDEQG